VGRLTAGITHEINTPMQFIGDNLHFLSTSLPTLLDLYARAAAMVSRACVSELGRHETEADLGFLASEMPRAISDALSGTANVARIVHAMSAFAKPNRSVQPVDVDAAMTTAVTIARNETKYVADVSLTLGDVGAVQAVEGDLLRAFVDLLVDAAQRSKSSKTRATIAVRTMCDGGDVVVEVGAASMRLARKNRP
jgi:two-component system NtrC family sensor kinase